MDFLSFFTKALLYAGIAAFALGVYACSDDGSRVFFTEQRVAELIDEDGLPEKDAWQVDDLSKAYYLEMGVSFDAIGSSCFMAAEILDENGNVINLLERDFWDEEGYEGGEYWREMEVSYGNTYRFDKPGTYYVRLHPDFENDGKQHTGKAYFLVKKGAMAGRWFIFLSVLLLIGWRVAYIFAD